MHSAFPFHTSGDPVTVTPAWARRAIMEPVWTALTGASLLPAWTALERTQYLPLPLLRERQEQLLRQVSAAACRDTAFYGGLLAIAVLYLFLTDVKTTVIISLTIPLSLLITFAPLNLLGVTLNIMSLGGLALGIGNLVDCSIVVLESVFRCRQEGDDIVSAAVRGTQEVKGAVIASTLTTVAVFFPIVFVEGIAGQAFGDLGWAVVISQIASLLVAIYFIPMLASRQKLQARHEGGDAKPWRSFWSWREFTENAAPPASHSFTLPCPGWSFVWPSPSYWN